MRSLRQRSSRSIDSQPRSLLRLLLYLQVAIHIHIQWSLCSIPRRSLSRELLHVDRHSHSARRSIVRLRSIGSSMSNGQHERTVCNRWQRSQYIFAAATSVASNAEAAVDERWAANLRRTAGGASEMAVSVWPAEYCPDSKSVLGRERFNSVVMF